MSESRYRGVVRKLNGLQDRKSAVRCLRPQQLGQTGAEVAASWIKYLKPSGFEDLRVIHIVGTKGKGSVVHYCERFVSEYSLQSGSQGITYGSLISPHLVEVRERIRLNGAPVEREVFAEHVDKLWQQVLNADRHAPPIPNYSQMMTLSALTLFSSLRPSIVFLEAGIGGRHDSTNVISNPFAVGITRIGLDHQERLGFTIHDIATQKAGILKNHCAVVSVPQEEEAKDVISAQFTHTGCRGALEFSKPSDQDHYGNIDLAHRLVRTVFRDWNLIDDDFELPSEALLRVASSPIPGRFHEINSNGNRFTLDVAHNPMSLKPLGKKWSAALSSLRVDALSHPHAAFGSGPQVKTAVIFLPRSGLDYKESLDSLFEGIAQGSCIEVDKLILCPAKTHLINEDTTDLRATKYGAAMERVLDLEHHCNEQPQYQSLLAEQKIRVENTLDDAIKHIESSGDQFSVLLTGTHVAVGLALEILGPDR